MSIISRRFFLRSSAAAGAALAGGAMPTLASPHQPEDQRLLDAGQVYARLSWEIEEASRAVAIARDVFEATKPPLPPELVHEGSAGKGLTRKELDYRLKQVRQEGAPRLIYSASEIERFHRRYFSRNDHRSRRMAALYQAALKYETEWSSAHIQSGLPPALKHEDALLERLFNLAKQISDMKPRSMAGLEIKARIISAYTSRGEQFIWAAFGAGIGRNLASETASLLREES